MHMKPHSVIAIPPKYLLIRMVKQSVPEAAGSKTKPATHGIRWGVVGGADQVRASMSMQAGWTEYFDGQAEMAALSEKLEAHKNELESH